jgi:hypothetical protein
VVVSSWATRHAILGGQRFSEGFRESVLLLSGFPTQAKSVVLLIDNLFPPKGKLNVYSNYTEVPNSTNNLSGFILVSCISSNGGNEMSLINLSNKLSRKIEIQFNHKNSGHYTDSLVGSDPRRQNSFSSRHRIWNPYISKEGQLTFLIPWNDLVSIDLKSGRELWRIRGSFHHSLEADSDGNFWVCAAIQPESLSNKKLKTRHSNKLFEDHALVKVSLSGKILKTISVADLLLDSGLEYLLYGSSNPDVNLDPIHLNQITPIIDDSGMFKKGQILVSLRNLSTILLVEPNSQLIVWHGSGNWMNQHCVMPTGASTFSVLDNHSFASGEFWLHQSWRTRIIKHNIENGHSTNVEVLRESPNNFRIAVEGRALPIDDEAWVIEDCTYGTIMLFRRQNLLFKWSNLYSDGTVGITSWCRYINSEKLPRFLTE